MTQSTTNETSQSGARHHDDVNRVLTSTRQLLMPILQAAIANEAAAQARRTELESSLEGLALDVSMLSGDASTASVDGTPINLDAMRAYVVQLSQEWTRAATLRQNIAMTMDVLASHANHFASDLAFTSAVDAVDERMQAAMVSVREQERRRLSREIHDGPAQVLTNAIYAIQIVEQVAKRSPQDVPEELARVRDLLKDGVTEVRRFMFDLRPTMLEDQGLTPTFRRWIEDYRRFFGRSVNLHIDDPLPALTLDDDLAVFRVMQEALQNIHKHAGVGATAWVSLFAEEDGVTLEIRDNGAGFNPEFAKAMHSSGHGLTNIRERAELAGGSLEIASAIGEGTTIRLRLKSKDALGAAGVLALV